MTGGAVVVVEEVGEGFGGAAGEMKTGRWAFRRMVSPSSVLSPPVERKRMGLVV